MSDSQRIKLEEYLEDYLFNESSHIQKDEDRLWVPEVFCHNGHSLMDEGTKFDGLPSIHIRARIGGEGGPKKSFFLSPIVGDSRKKGPELPEGTRLMLLCPKCNEELKKLVPCNCRVNAYKRAVYLTPDPKELGAIGLCEIYGCPQSFVSEDGELVLEMVKEDPAIKPT